jgi:hypothetical protein
MTNQELMMNKKRVLALAIQGLEVERAKVLAEMAGIQQMLADIRDGRPSPKRRRSWRTRKGV